MRLQPGAVRDGIKSYLREKGADGASIQDIHRAVGNHVGQDVARSSVRSYLNINTPGQFERVSRGVYRISNV